MKKPLSLNTQLTKLRTVNNLLKQSISEAVYIKDNGFKDTSYSEEIKQVIYSLRDIQYRLRGLNKYSAHRKAQTRKMDIIEIRNYLKSLYSIENPGFGPNFRQNMFKSYDSLGSVEQYLQLNGQLNDNRIDTDELF